LISDKGIESSLVLSYKFSFLRKSIVKRFFPEISKNINNITDIKNYIELGKPIKLLVWGAILEEEGIDIDFPNVEIYRLEDGFIRSIGLGIKFTPPISIIVDPMGIYFNSNTPSYLEYIFSSYDFDQKIKLRAKNLIKTINQKKINKYNLEEKEWKPPKTDKKIIVVPGQVEKDMSIKYGSPYIKTNIELLKKVREKNPDEFIVYKPHPDVVSGYRKGNYSKNILLEFCNYVCENCSTFSLIEYADEIHTLTSLFGFEALLKNKKVVCYGQPFYSGWGLTEDIFPVKRRKRKLSIEELVAGSLILYPIYVSLINGKKIIAEEALEELDKLRREVPMKLKLWNLIGEIADPLLKLRKLYTGR